MSTVKVERRHREAALVAMYGEGWTREMLHTRVWAWRDGEALTPATAHQVPAAVVNAAKAIAAAEQRVREECATQVEALAAGAERDRDEASAVRDHGRYSAFSGVAKRLRALAERMRAGGGV